MGFSLFDVVASTVKSVAEANVIPIGLLSKVVDAYTEDDPNLSAGDRYVNGQIGSLSYLTDLLVPGVAIAKSLPSLFKGEPDVAGAGGVPIIAAGLAVLKEALDQCGEGDLDTGAEYATGAAGFRTIADGIGRLNAPDDWTGSAAQAYTFANGLQQQRAQEMSEYDERIHKAVASEAEQVKDTRDVIRTYARLLNACIVPATTLGNIPEVGDALTYSFQLQAVQMFVPPAMQRFRALVDQTAAHAAEVTSAGNSYNPIRGEYDGRAPQFDNEPLHVVPGDLRLLSDGQNAVAAAIGISGRTTEGAADAVEKSHGTVSSGTATALRAAHSARSETATWMRGQSEKLSNGLTAAAAAYTRVDEEKGHKLQGEMPPR